MQPFMRFVMFVSGRLLIGCPLMVVIWVDSESAIAQTPAKDNQDAKDVLARVTGHVIWVKSRSELVAISLPTMKESVVRQFVAKDIKDNPVFHAISGPDGSGRIAYIEDHFFVAESKDQRHLLKTIQIDGTRDTEVFSRPGSAMWAATSAGRGEIGAYVALAPSGGRVAFLSGLTAKQMPGALLHEGEIEIWDVEKKLKCDTTVKAINQPMSWFPDGKRLAFVRLVACKDLPEKAIGIQAFGKPFGNSWDEVPAVYIFDVVSGKSTFLHVGWTPVVSSVGDVVLVGGWDSHSKFSWRQLALNSGSTSAIQWPGDAGGAIAVPNESVVLYQGLPTADAPLKFTKNNSALVGPKLMISLKIAIVNSDKSQTVIPEFDPRDLLSFGRLRNTE